MYSKIVIAIISYISYYYQEAAEPTGKPWLQSSDQSVLLFKKESKSDHENSG